MRFPLIFGLAALLCLFAAGWQMRQMQVEEARVQAASRTALALPDTLPDAPDPERDLFRPVRVAGTLVGDPVLLPVTHPQMGDGFRVVQALDLGARRILLDRGFLYAAWKDDPITNGFVEVNGNLDWTSDAVDVAERLRAAPVLVVAATPTGDGLVPMPVDAASLKGDAHVWMAVFFALAAVFTGVTLALQWRIKRRDEGNVTQ